ncbi:MAG: HEXXH motif-containing putative peptide modification protein [Polyangiaceae bacterium]
MDDLPCGFLALPSGDDTTMTRLTRKLRLLVLQRLLVTPPSSVPAPVSGALSRLQGILQQLAKDKGRARVLLDVLGRVEIMMPLLFAESGQLRIDDALRRAVPSLLVQLGAALPERASREQILWDVPVAVLFDGTRCLRFDPPAQGVLVDGRRVRLRNADGDELPWPEVVDPSVTTEISMAGPRLSLVDANPLSMLEEHPDKEGNALDLGGREAGDWTGAIEAALGIVEATIPTLHRELVGHLQRIVPVGYEAERHLSASYREAPGQIYMSLHPSTLTMAEALVHETQHGKLNTLRWFDAVLHNGDSTWSESPVRPDLRPLMGVLMGVHAFVPVAAMHRRLEELEDPIVSTPHFARRRHEVSEGNASGLKTIRELGELTAAGERVVSALEALHAATGGSLSP